MTSRGPCIGIPADRRVVNGHPFHMVGEKYIRAVLEAAEAWPLVIPSLGPDGGAMELLGRLDGLLLTGSPSNVEPHHYDGPPSAAGTWHDPARDSTTLPLIRAALAAAVPLLALCRGFQELNVALGGTLHQRLQEVPGLTDHREDPAEPLEAQYRPVHEVQLSEGGLLRRFAGAERIRVNSLHSQGIDRLAAGLIVEARAPDGLIEAVRVGDAAAFAVAVQWHPEWQVMRDPFSRALFAAFGDAARERASRRRVTGDPRGRGRLGSGAL